MGVWWYEKIIFYFILLFRSCTRRNNLESLSYSATNGIIKLQLSHFTFPFSTMLSSPLLWADFHPLKCICQSPNSQDFKEVVRLKECIRTLIHYDKCPYKKRRLRHRHTQRDEQVRTEGKI